MLLSIIIPVYNAAPFLKKCIESVIGNMFEESELILINDGSTDISANICKKYATSFPRVYFISQENLGVSSARNLGLSYAKGKYVMFVDSDDWLEPYFGLSIKDILNKDNVDIIQYGYVSYDKKGVQIVHLPKKRFLYDDLDDYFLDKNYHTAVWGYIINRNLIEENKLRFTVDIKYAEDQLFILKVFYNSKKVYTINEYYYNYNYVETSVMNKSIDYSRAENIFLVIRELVKYYSLNRKNIALYKWGVDSLFENYLRIIAKIPFTMNLLEKINLNMDEFYIENKDSLEILTFRMKNLNYFLLYL